MEQRQIQRKIKKLFRQEKLKSLGPRECPISPKVSLMKMCEAYDHPEFFKPIYNQMVEKIFDDTESRYAKHSFFAAEGEDIYFDKIGALIWNDLLENYFTEEQLDQVVDTLFFWDDRAWEDFRVQSILQKSSRKELRKWLSKDYEADSEFVRIAVQRGLDGKRRSTAAAEFKKAISEELERRKKPRAMLQRMYKWVKNCPDGVYM